MTRDGISVRELHHRQVRSVPLWKIINLAQPQPDLFPCKTNGPASIG